MRFYTLCQDVELMYNFYDKLLLSSAAPIRPIYVRARVETIFKISSKLPENRLTPVQPIV